MPPRQSSSKPAAASRRTPSKPRVNAAPAQQQQPNDIAVGETSASAIAAAQKLAQSLSVERQVAFCSLNPTVNEIVPPSALKNLKNYAYATVDNSILQKYCGIGKYWDFVVSFVPYWIAPNMLTLLAAVCSMSYPLLVMYFENHLEPDQFIPNWVWFFAALALFAYQTLDSIDGKHARRTGAKGPLGEMFDHGCDALFTPFMLYTSCRCMNLSASQTYVFCLVSAFTLYATIFEQFLSGVFILPAVNGPTEGILISCGLYLLTFFKGGSAWWATKLASPVVADLPATLVAAFKLAPGAASLLPDSILVAESYSDVAFVVSTALGIATAVYNCRNAFHRLAGDRKDAISNFAVNILVLATWALFALIHPDSAYGNARAFCLLFGTYFAFAASDLTVHRLVQLPARLSKKFLVLCLVYPVAKLLIFRNRFGNDASDAAGSSSAAVGVGCAWCKCVPAGLAFIMFGCYIFYLLSVFNQFARGLGINVVTLTAAQLKVSEAEAFKRHQQGKR